MTDERATSSGSAVAEAFPALRRLSWRRPGRRVPYVQQLEWADCAAASLAMVLRYHQREVKLDDVREVCGSGRDGADARAMLAAGEWYGLRGRALQLDVEDVDRLPPASVLHWEFNHFVVYERTSRSGVMIVDPARGRRTVPLDHFRKAFTGVALVFEPSEAFEPGKSGEHRTWSYLRQLVGQRHLLGRIVVVSVLLRLFALALPLLTGVVVDRVVPRGDHHLLTVVVAGMGAMVIFHLLSALIRSHLLLQLRTNLDTRMTLSFFQYLIGLPYMYFQRRSAGDLMMRINSNTTIREILTAGVLSGLLDGSLVVIYLALILLFSPGLALLVLGLGVLEVITFVLSRRGIRDLMARGLEAQAHSQGYLVQVMAGIESLKACGAEGRAVEHWSNLYVDELNASLARGRLQARAESLLGALGLGGPLVVLSCSAALVIAGDLSLGTALALNALAIGFLAPLQTLVISAIQLQVLGSYIERIDDVLTNEPEQRREDVVRADRLRGRIEVEGLSFRYGPRAPLVVRDVSIGIEPGATLAIVGPSGSGKSTLAKLLVALYPPTEGKVLYDGRDLAGLDVRSVRRQLGIVPQHPFIFGRSIRDNIALAEPSASMDRIVAAARKAAIHDDIVAMPMAYETIVADGGTSLSGGQRQRLALARALVNQPAVLLLDEATSSLDANTEAAVVASLDALPCTRIVIAHRLSTIAGADRILVMEEGRIVEDGTHLQLLARRGHYHALVHAQSDMAGGAEAAR